MPLPCPLSELGHKRCLGHITVIAAAQQGDLKRVGGYLTGTWAGVKLRLEAMRAAIRLGVLPGPRDRPSGGRAIPRRISVKGFGAQGPAGAEANGHASAAETGSELEDEGSEMGRAQGRRVAKRRLERSKAESAPKAAKKGERP